MNANYLQQLNAARAKGTQDIDFKEAMKKVKESKGILSEFDSDDLQELDETLTKLESLTDVFEKYARTDEKLKNLLANTELIEKSLGTIQDEETEPLPNCTQKETYAINVQLIKEFETESRLSKDLLKLSEKQVLEEEIPDEIPPYDNLTKEQTVQVYMQVIEELTNQTELADKIKYNAGV